MPTYDGRMNGEELDAALDTLGLTKRGLVRLLLDLGDAGEIKHKHRRVLRMITGEEDVPGLLVAILQLLVLMQDNAGITPDTVRAWLADAVVPGDDTEPADVAPAG